MEKQPIFYRNQEATYQDISNIGKYTRESFDHLVHDAIGNSTRFWGFPVVEAGAVDVNIGEGRLYSKGEVFARNEAGGVKLSLTDYLPAVTKKIVTVVIWGHEVEQDVVPVTFLVDAESNQTEARPVAKTNTRFAEINIVPGEENADPRPPVLDANLVALAHITLTPKGIAYIEMIETNRLISIEKMTGDLHTVKDWMLSTGTRIDTLDTDMTALAAGLKGTVRQEEFFDAAADIGRLKAKLNMPEDLSFWGADHLLSLEQSDSDDKHPDFYCKVEEGARFPAVAESRANINLLDPLEKSVTLTGDFALPAYTPKVRLDLAGKDGEVILSQYVIQQVKMVQKTRTRTRTRYGSTKSVCTNQSWWRSGQYDPTTGIFRRDGETWEVAAGDRYNAQIYNRLIRVTQFWYDSYADPYWEAVPDNFSVNGAIAAQTWLNAQDGWLTHIDLFFSQLAKEGDIHVLITETDHGAPAIDKVIARTTIHRSDLKLYPQATHISLPPTLVSKGRYAVVLVTSGAHMACTINGNKYSQGQYFYCGDGGGWFMGDAKIDLAMRLYYAHFNTTRAEVNLQPWVLSGGIGELDILAESFVPAGCQLAWQIKVNGQWKTLAADMPDLLLGLKPLYEARAVFIGTTDLMPCLTFGAASTVVATRSATRFCHVSAARHMPKGVNLVELRLRLEYFESQRHQCDADLLVGSDFKTQLKPISVRDYLTETPNAIERRWQFKASNLQAYKIRTKGTSNNALITYHVAERVDIGRGA